MAQTFKMVNGKLVQQGLTRTQQANIASSQRPITQAAPTFTLSSGRQTALQDNANSTTAPAVVRNGASSVLSSIAESLPATGKTKDQSRYVDPKRPRPPTDPLPADSNTVTVKPGTVVGDQRTSYTLPGGAKTAFDPNGQPKTVLDTTVTRGSGGLLSQPGTNSVTTSLSPSLTQNQTGSVVRPVASTAASSIAGWGSAVRPTSGLGSNSNYIGTFTGNDGKTYYLTADGKAFNESGVQHKSKWTVQGGKLFKDGKFVSRSGTMFGEADTIGGASGDDSIPAGDDSITGASGNDWWDSLTQEQRDAWATENGFVTDDAITGLKDQISELEGLLTRENPQYDPEFNSQVNASQETIEGRIQNLLATDSGGNFTNPAVQQAAQAALDIFAQRGLLNSSSATQGALEAAISKATEIAQHDAGVYTNNRINNVEWKNRFAGNDQSYRQQVSLRKLDQSINDSTTDKTFARTLQTNYIGAVTQFESQFNNTVASIQAMEIPAESKTAMIEQAKALKDINVHNITEAFAQMPGATQEWKAFAANLPGGIGAAPSGVNVANPAEASRDQISQVLSYAARDPSYLNDAQFYDWSEMAVNKGLLAPADFMSYAKSDAGTPAAKFVPWAIGAAIDGKVTGASVLEAMRAVVTGGKLTKQQFTTYGQQLVSAGKVTQGALDLALSAIK